MSVLSSGWWQSKTECKSHDIKHSVYKRWLNVGLLNPLVPDVTGHSDLQKTGMYMGHAYEHTFSVLGIKLHVTYIYDVWHQRVNNTQLHLMRSVTCYDYCQSHVVRNVYRSDCDFSECTHQHLQERPAKKPWHTSAGSANCLTRHSSMCTEVTAHSVQCHRQCEGHVQMELQDWNL
jgi:hypothetical protein